MNVTTVGVDLAKHVFATSMYLRYAKVMAVVMAGDRLF